MTLPDFMSGFTASSVFMVLKDVLLGGADVSMTHWGTNGDSDFYPFSDGGVYIGDGSTARKTCGTAITALDAFHIFSLTSASGAWNLYLNGASQFSTGSNTVAFTSSPAFGRNTWGGDVAEIIVYDSALGSTDRGSVESYLNTKYFGAAGVNTAAQYYHQLMGHHVP